MKTLNKLYETSPVFYFLAFFAFGYMVTDMIIKVLKNK